VPVKGAGRGVMMSKWEPRQYGKGWKRKSFTIEQLNGDWCLKCNGQFVASFKTAGSCKRVADCILREFGRLDETMHYKPKPRTTEGADR